MKLILHIGTEKTGTTSIQNFLKLNRIKLKKHGYYIPKSPALPSGNHRWITLIAYDKDRTDDFIQRQNFKDKEDQIDQIHSHKLQFLSECEKIKHTDNTVILSSEHFQSRLQSDIEIQRLRSFLDEIFSEITIVIYIRDPLKTAVSALSTAIKMGATYNHLPPPSHKSFNKIFDHATTIEKWKRCFPKSNIIIRRFDKSLLAGNNVVIDFCKYTMPDLDTKRFDILKPLNETLSLTGLALLRKMNLLLPRFIDNQPNQLRGGMPRWINSKTNDGTKFFPCIEEFEDYRDYFHASCESIRSEYFPNEKILFPPQETFSKKKIILSDQEIPAECYEKLILSLWKQTKKHKLLAAE